MPRVKVVVIGRTPKWMSFEDTFKVEDMKKAITEVFGIHSPCIVFKGVSLMNDSQRLQFKDGDTLLVTERISVSSAITEERIQDPDEELKYRLQPNASPLRKWMYQFLKYRIKLPDIVLYWLFTIRPFTYFVFFAWMFFSPIAARLDLGPIYILGTIFLLIVINLGVRREGELSGYSLFNENFRSLPGQLRAEEIDRQLRQGRM